ncbi:acyl carrier protein [Flavobacterium arsenatis]|uniref:Acyl carrier protein n=1 Tax=Flavobacterium arsenatis TaxID=1484332 RepID=A0ABU1TNA5_9FLAO|nr:acyl carrier protein [Flavobacterium arsenatis]MDR6967368.1 acyl carrier protein [Flavobacterium arsenatis]
MKEENLINKLKIIIKPYVKDEEALKNLNEKTDFINDLMINSANLVDIVLDIEETFDIVIDNEAMEKMLNVEAALQIIETELAKR